ncbi:Outer membrane low permeability porin OccD7/OpdB proline [Pseudomonas chlororaphis subsp. aureofaciens]|uniref:OprD family porin n=1 Tax=Pseudomonas chlororaphis TaxID=587753 RepID=UPI000F5666E1|nr:OprD family porin [Pseudomonas chlororaphis]AZE12029.1 Outer membrane low permeability porin OccD7/OpdB proline [Pseudomonas chlororaphis subsp. aureofaciens]
MLLASKHLTAPGPPRLRLKPLWLLALLSGGAPALAAQGAQDTPGFLEGASLEVLSRNFYLNNDYRSPTPAGKSYKQEWAQGFIASFESGFTPGTIGVGVDAHGFLGLKLDGGKGHSGTGLLPLDHDGRSEDSYSSAGGALKFKASRTTLALGEMTVATPVFDTADKRLQPEYASGLLLSSRELEGLDLQAGHFNAFKNQDASTAKGDFSGYGATTRHASIDFIGADLFAGQALGGALYASELSDTWRQYYANLHASLGQLFLDGNLYRTRDQGQAAAGAIDTTAYSLSGKYRIDAQAFTLAYQKVHGDTPFDFVGGDSIYLANSIKYADFNGPGERSWQARYDLDLGALGIPGLSFMARYVSGRGIDGSHAPQGGAYNPFDSASGTYSPQQGRGGRHWERDLDLHYIVQSGPAKDLSLQLSHVSHRANAAQAGDDIDRLYIVIQYPLKLGPF